MNFILCIFTVVTVLFFYAKYRIALETLEDMHDALVEARDANTDALIRLGSYEKLVHEIQARYVGAHLFVEERLPELIAKEQEARR